MPHCPPDQLDDLAGVLAELRTWPRVIEKKPGVFYVRREPFLHFHLIPGGHRRADVKSPSGWAEIDLPRPASATRCRALLRELQSRYAEKMKPAAARAPAGAVRQPRRG